MKRSIDLRFIVCTLPKRKSIRVLLVVGNSKNMHCSTTVLVPGMSQMCPWHHGNEPFSFSQTRNGEHLQFLLHELPLTKTGRIKIRSELKAWNNWWTHSSMGLDPELQIECTAGSQHSVDPLLDFLLKAFRVCWCVPCPCHGAHCKELLLLEHPRGETRQEPFPSETRCVHSAGSKLGGEYFV